MRKENLEATTHFNLSNEVTIAVKFTFCHFIYSDRAPSIHWNGGFNSYFKCGSKNMNPRSPCIFSPQHVNLMTKLSKNTIQCMRAHNETIQTEIKLKKKNGGVVTA